MNESAMVDVGVVVCAWLENTVANIGAAEQCKLVSMTGKHVGNSPETRLDARLDV